jgi:hypothetical protein
MAEEAVATQNDSAGTGWPAATIEQRVQRLEDAVASLQNTGAMEERITQRLAERLEGRPALSHQIVESRSSSLPLLKKPAPGNSGTAPPLDPALMRQPWLLFDFLAELGAIVRMFFDVRYHVGWSARLTVLVLVPLILLSQWWLQWFPLVWIPIVGPVLDKVVDLFLAFLVYKALSREARRYQQLRADRQRASW